MDACLACGVDYIDNCKTMAARGYRWIQRWRAIYEKRCKDEGFTAYFDIHGSGHIRSVLKRQV